MSCVYSEEELLPLSGLQHLMFCERQAALIYLEGIWRDNPLTLEGSYLHKKVDDDGPRREIRDDTIIVRGLALRSIILGLSGRADVVEFHRNDEASGSSSVGTRLDGLPGSWIPLPVEYKHGKPKPDRCDEVQLCAQAICLEEMLMVAIGEGALFYGKTKRRHPVLFDESLRSTTKTAATRYHALLGSGRTPIADLQPKCRGCSLIDDCMPGSASRHRSGRKYVTDLLHEELGGAP